MIPMMALASMLLSSLPMTAQPRYDYSSLQREPLNRGVVAVRTPDGKVLVSWRLLMEDGSQPSFQLYRNGLLLTPQPLHEGGTCFLDEEPLSTDAVYEVKGGSRNGSFTLKADAPAGYLPIAIDKPANGITPDGATYSYSANDASVGDVDGDGQYEIILKWDPSNAHDNAHDGFTGNTLFDCYRLDGTRLWRIDMGPNVRSGAHYIPFIVYDLDGDGKAELMVKTGDGTIDGKGQVIGDAHADWRHGVQEAMEHFEENKQLAAQQAKLQEEQWRQWREMNQRADAQRRPDGPERPDGPRPPKNGKRPKDAQQPRPKRPAMTSLLKGIVKSAGRIMDGPEYLTVFNGLTGEAMATVDYVPERGMLTDWGDNHANRSDRYLAGVGYLDGKRASAFFCRGYYTRTVIAAWDWDGKTLSQHWVFDTNNPEWKDYAGQGNHNLRVADVDGDGCDEIIYGSMAVDHDGRGLYNTGMGHGDAMHLTVFDPSTDKLQLWDCHENKRDGSELRDAATGKVIFQIKSQEDVGRCMAADIDPTRPGLEMWSSDSHGIRDLKGELVTPTGEPANATKADDGVNPSDNTSLYFRGRRLPVNFAVWWDGDLLREMLDHETVSKYDWTTGQCNPLIRFEGCSFNNGTKSNPCLSGDLLGDWREEVLVRTADSRELRLYVSPVPTSHRICCLMQDIPYRLSVATENVGYNQPPHTGFYLGER